MVIAAATGLGWSQGESLPKFRAEAVGRMPDENLTVFGTTVIIPNGLKGLIYEIPPLTTDLPKFEKLKPIGVIYTYRLNIPSQDFMMGFPGVTKRNEWFAIDYTGRFYIDTPGKYAFFTASDDGTRLYIDGKLLIENDGIHSMIVREAGIKLSGGLHSIRLSYFQGPRYDLGLILGVRRPVDRDWILFDMNLFKPPTKAEDWKYGSPDDLSKP